MQQLIDALQSKSRGLRIAGVVFICLLLLLALFPVPVLATDAPDSDPSITDIKVNTYLIEYGDVLIYGKYDIPYSAIPDEPASDTFIFRLLDTDGETELGAVTPYPYFDIGYNKGVFSFYFSASDNLTWNEPYLIRISENPIYFDTVESWDFVVSGGSYSAQTTQEANQIELAVNVIQQATWLENYLDGYTLIEDSAGGTVLSSPTGETYFRGAIYGIQAMAPRLFLVQTILLDTTNRDWDTTQFDEYEGRYEGTVIGTTANATGTQFGVSGQMVMGYIFVVPVCFGWIIVSAWKFKRTEPGFINSMLTLTMGSAMGWVPAALFGTVIQVHIIYLAYLWHYSRS